MCRPSLEVVEKKINELYGLDKCEENESVPELMNDMDEYSLPSSYDDLVQERHPTNKKDSKKKKEKESSKDRGSGSPVVAPPTNKKKKIIEED